MAATPPSTASTEPGPFLLTGPSLLDFPVLFNLPEESTPCGSPVPLIGLALMLPSQGICFLCHLSVLLIGTASAEGKGGEGSSDFSEQWGSCGVGTGVVGGSGEEGGAKGGGGEGGIFARSLFASCSKHTWRTASS
jgi:hypothetical protein